MIENIINENEKIFPSIERFINYNKQNPNLTNERNINNLGINLKALNLYYQNLKREKYNNLYLISQLIALKTSVENTKQGKILYKSISIYLKKIEQIIELETKNNK